MPLTIVQQGENPWTVAGQADARRSMAWGNIPGRALLPGTPSRQCRLISFRAPLESFLTRAGLVARIHVRTRLNVIFSNSSMGMHSSIELRLRWDVNFAKLLAEKLFGIDMILRVEFESGNNFAQPFQVS